MDKKDKSLDDIIKNSLNQGANPFLNAASLLGGKGKKSPTDFIRETNQITINFLFSAYWGNNNGNGSGSRENINNISQLQQFYGSMGGMGMVPAGFGMDKATTSSQVPNANNMNSSE